MPDKDDPTDRSVTFINVFEIPADKVDAFLPGWRERARIMSTMPGFRDYRMHRAISGDSRFQLVVVGHWDSPDALAAAMANPDFRAQMRALDEDPDLRISYSPALYEVAVSDTRHE